MGLFDGLLGGVVAAEVTHLVTAFIEQHGGVQGLVAQFEKQGMGSTIQSWIGTGPNQPITAEDLEKVIGSDVITQFATRFGMNPQEILQKVAQALPEAVDKLTPSGVIPKV